MESWPRHVPGAYEVVDAAGDHYLGSKSIALPTHPDNKTERRGLTHESCSPEKWMVQRCLSGVARTTARMVPDETDIPGRFRGSKSKPKLTQRKPILQNAGFHKRQLLRDLDIRLYVHILIAPWMRPRGTASSPADPRYLHSHSKPASGTRDSSLDCSDPDLGKGSATNLYMNFHKP